MDRKLTLLIFRIQGGDVYTWFHLTIDCHAGTVCPFLHGGIMGSFSARNCSIWLTVVTDFQPFRTDWEHK